MFSTELVFENLEGEEVKQKVYFSISKAEVYKMTVGTNGSMGDRLENIVNEKDKEKIYDTMIDLIDMSYGVRSDDNVHFYKTSPKDGHKLVEDWKATPAYDAFLDKLFYEEGFSSKFVSMLIPQSMRKELAEAKAAGKFDKLELNDEAKDALNSLDLDAEDIKPAAPELVK